MKSPDKDKWIEAIQEEYNKTSKYEVFQLVPVQDIERNARILSSKLVMKKKANGTYKAMITAKAMNKHFDEHSIAKTVVDDLAI